MNFEIVTELSQLERVCIQAKNAPVIMLDTEFVRTRTLYPKLGLIQLYDGQSLSLIDPILLDDLSPLWALLVDPDVLKVFHACGEDLEVFFHHANLIPTPMVDTQIMAAFMGHGLSTGFAALVKEYLDVALDKGESRADWCARPLTQKQLEYAAADVFYLFPLYNLLLDRVCQAGWFEAVKEECQMLQKKRGNHPDPEKAYLGIKNVWQLAPPQLLLIKKLASWRLKEAQRRDLAINFVIKDLNLWKMARFDIQSLAKMADEGLDRFEIERHGRRLLRIVEEVKHMPASSYPPPILQLVDMPGYKQAMKLIKDETNAAAESLKMVTEFVASKKQIHQILKWAWLHERDEASLPDLFIGWRKEYLYERIMLILDKK